MDNILKYKYPAGLCKSPVSALVLVALVSSFFSWAAKQDRKKQQEKRLDFIALAAFGRATVQKVRLCPTVRFTSDVSCL